MSHRSLPAPLCRLGYTRAQIVQIMGPRLEEFDEWFYGQTAAICTWAHRVPWRSMFTGGTRGPHGVVVYPHDVRRFLARGGRR